MDKGGKLTKAMDVRGFETTVSGNAIHTANTETPLVLAIRAGNAVVNANVLQNVVIEVNDETEEQKPILIKDNIMDNSSVRHVKGNLKTE